MANNFKNSKSRGIGTSYTSVGGYTVPINTQCVALSGILANSLVGTDINVYAGIYDGTNLTMLINGALVIAGGAIVLPKFVLMPGESLQVKSSVAASVDASISYLEKT